MIDPDFITFEELSELIDLAASEHWSWARLSRHVKQSMTLVKKSWMINPGI